MDNKRRTYSLGVVSPLKSAWQQGVCRPALSCSFAGKGPGEAPERTERDDTLANCPPEGEEAVWPRGRIIGLGMLPTLDSSTEEWQKGAVLESMEGPFPLRLYDSYLYLRGCRPRVVSGGGAGHGGAW